MAMKARLDGGRSAPTSLTVQSKMWATPKTVDGYGGSHAMESIDDRPRGRGADLKSQAKMWPTPKASEGFRGTDPARPGRTGGDSLKQAVAAWPTPTAGDGSRASHTMMRGNPTLLGVASGHPDETTSKAGPTGPPEADLNPSFVESLMGLPDGWSDPSGSASGFTRWVTDWSLKLEQSLFGS